MGLYPEQTPSAFAHETVTVAGVAIGFTAATYNPGGRPGATRAFITLETAQISYRYDGGTPTSSVGHLMDAGGTLVLEGPANISNFLAIRTGGTSGTIKVTFEG